MHRSGTSAITRVLSLLGARLPNDLMRPAEGVNDLGFWESKEVQRLNDDALAAVGSSWDGLLPIPRRWFSSSEAEGLRQRILNFLARDFEGSSLFVLKDPRFCRLIPLWEPALEEFGAEGRYVHVFRHPMEVARSLGKRDGFDTDRSLLLWLRHILEAEEETRDRPRSFHSFSELLADWQRVVARITADLGIDWPRPVAEARQDVERFLKPDERHHREDSEAVREEPFIPVHQVHGALRELARCGPGGERAGAALAEIDEVRARIEAMDRLYQPALHGAAPGDRPDAGDSNAGEPEVGGAEDGGGDDSVGEFGPRELRDELDRLHLEVRAKNFEIDRRGRALRRLEGRLAELNSTLRSSHRRTIGLLLRNRRLETVPGREDEG